MDWVLVWGMSLHGRIVLVGYFDEGVVLFLPGAIPLLVLVRMLYGRADSKVGRMCSRAVYEILLHMFSIIVVAEASILWFGTLMFFAVLPAPILHYVTIFISLFIYLKVGLWLLQRDVNLLVARWSVWGKLGRVLRILGILAWISLFGFTMLVLLPRLFYGVFLPQ